MIEQRSHSDTGSRLARSAGLISIATLASRLLGLVREQVIAFLFGAGDAVDAYNVAFRIPNLFRDLFAEGAMSAAFVPTFTRQLTLKGREAAWRLGNSVLNSLILVTLSLVVLGLIFAEPIVRLLAGDYAQQPGKLELTILLTRIMLPFLTLVAMAAALMGMLNSLHRFFVPAFSPAMFNLGTILCAILLVPIMNRLGWPGIVAIAIGTIVGGIGQVVVQWPSLHREGFRYRPVIDLRDEALRQVAVLMGPGLIGLAGLQINLFVNTVLATKEGTGAVAWLAYAFRLMYVPIGLFGVSIATAALPAISRDAAREATADMQRTISRGLRLMLMLNVPAALGLIALAPPIVRLIFEHGQFTAADTVATAAALALYAPGLLGYSAVKIGVPSFYALGDSRTPVMVSFASVIANAALSLALVRVLGYRGLALGTALAALFNATLLLVLLGRRLGGLDARRIAVTFAKILVASTLMAVAAWRLEALLHGVIAGERVIAQAARLALAIAGALAVLAAAARALRIEEFTSAIDTVTRRLRPVPRG